LIERMKRRRELKIVGRHQREEGKALGEGGGAVVEEEKGIVGFVAAAVGQLWIVGEETAEIEQIVVVAVQQGTAAAGKSMEEAAAE
jgi:hypothetical protein